MKKMVISVSGGRTSAYMANWMLNNKDVVEAFVGEPVEYIYLFANTGMEHEDTLRFMQAVNENLLGNQVVWLESIAHHGERKGCTHKVVDYNSAYRNNQWDDEGHPFKSVIAKYGVPNQRFPYCTRELKLNPIKSYLRSLGLEPKDYYTAIGIRDDEKRRVSKSATESQIIYPLIDLEPTDKQDVIEWFSRFEWDLKIPEHQGNCVTCWKKSFKKLQQIYSETPQYFEFNRSMEKKFGRVGPEFAKYADQLDRVFFRGGLSTDALINTFNITEPSKLSTLDGGCSESCEMYEVE